MAEPARIVLSAVDRTSAAFQSAKRNLADLNKASDGVAAKFGTIGLAVTAAFEGVSFKAAIDAGDQLSKLSQKTGITVEDLSALKLAGQLADVPIETLAKGVKTLSVNMASAAGGGQQAQNIFRTLGVSVQGTDGALRSVDDVLGDVADKFAGYEDGAGKAALAQEVFGKAGSDLIPVLNQGRQGLADVRKEAEQLGVVFDKQLAEDAERFNDALTRLGVAAQGAKISLLRDLLPTLDSTLEAFVANTKAAGLFRGALLTIGQGLSQRLGLDELGQLQSQASGISDEIGRVTNVMVGLSNVLARDPGNEAAQRRYDSLGKKLKDLQGQALQTGDAIKKLANDQTVAATPKKKEDEAKKKAAPVVPATTGGTGNELGALKQELDGRTQAIQQSLIAEQQLLKFNEQYVETVYRSGNTTLESTFTAQDELRRRNIEEIRRAAADTIAAEQSFQAKIPEPKDTAGQQRNDAAVKESENRIQAARAKLEVAEREFQQATDLSAVQRPEQSELLKQQVAQFNAGVQELVDGGKSRAIELADIAIKTREATKLLVEGGADPADAARQAQAFGALLEQQRQLNLARDEFARVTDKARDAEEKLLLEQQAGGTGLLEGERQVFELRQKELAQLDALIDRLRQLSAAQPDNLALIDSLRKAELEAQRLRVALDPTKLRLDAAADNIGDAIAGGLSRANMEGKTLSQTIKGIGLNIADIVEKELITKPLSKQIGEFVKGSGGQGAGENLIGKLFGINNPAAAGGKTLGETAGGAENAGLRALFKAEDPTAQLNASFGALQATGVDPTTLALTRLQMAADGAAGALGGAPAAGTAGPTLGDFTRTDHADVQTAAELAQTDAAVASKAFADEATTAGAQLARLAASASQGGSALSLLPQIISLIGTAATTSTTTGGSGFGGFFASLFGGSSSGGIAGNDIALAYHDGGVIGESGSGDARAVLPGLFNLAPRFHGGGVVGQHEVVLQAGEELLDPSHPRHRDNAPAGPHDSPAMQMLAKQGGIVVKRLGVPLPGLAADEVPAVLPQGTEVLTADDPRHSANLGGAQPGHAGRDGADGTVMLLNGAKPAGADRHRTWDPDAWDNAVRHHSGGIVGVGTSGGGAPLAHADARMAASESRQGEGKGGDNYFNLSGLKVDSHGYMDAMAEERAAARIARKAQGFLARRSA